MTSVAIIAAMEEEITPLKGLLKDLEITVIAGFKYYTGYFSDKKIILLRSGIGKVNSTISTTLLLEKFKPDYVLNTGSAGAVDLSLKIGDLVISNKVCHHDVDITSFGYEKGQIPGLPTFFLPGNSLVKLAKEQLAILADTSYHFGLIVSGDRFVCTRDDVKKLKQIFPAVMACEMEAASVAQVCHIFNIPFLIIRAISDIPGENNAIDFKIFLQQAVKNYTDFLPKILYKI
ncbi:MAG: 5'-methylthioadenosine/adenosylhomocysteine nucleosidase [Endozoicomonadaceae bacterium]|nr:5'-methylthioadenosine/adenosylhomocysteine nucleosidase [Endozoicomonadaceae bacterium]